MCLITFKHLQTLSNLEDNPELIDDFFGMLIRIGKYTPKILANNQSVATIFQVTLLSAGSNIIKIAKSVYSFVEVVFLMTKHSDFPRIIYLKSLRLKSICLGNHNKTFERALNSP